jgi:hypothetical protein
MAVTRAQTHKHTTKPQLTNSLPITIQNLIKEKSQNKKNMAENKKLSSQKKIKPT